MDLGCPGCADDILLITEDPEELRMMLTVASAYSRE